MDSIEHQQMQVEPGRGRHHPEQLDVGILVRSEGQNPAAPPPGDFNQPFGFRDIKIERGRAARLQNALEQLSLGLVVRLHRAVIVEMVAAEIGERGGPNQDPIKPVLIKAVA